MKNHNIPEAAGWACALIGEITLLIFVLVILSGGSI